MKIDFDLLLLDDGCLDTNADIQTDIRSGGSGKYGYVVNLLTRYGVFKSATFYSLIHLFHNTDNY